MRYAVVVLLVLGSCAQVAYDYDPADFRTHNEPTGERSAVVDRVFVENGQREYEHGVFLKVDFRVYGCYGQRCTLVAYFYDSNRNTLKDRNGEYRAVDGSVATIEDFTPGFDGTRYDKYPLFIPHNEFHVGPGRHNFLFKISVFWRDSNGGYHHIHTSNYYGLQFTWYLQESGELRAVKVDYNHKKDNENGIRFELDYTVRNMVGRRGRFVVEFYYELSKFSFLYKRGRKEEGIMRFTIEFTPEFNVTNYNGGYYWVPYKDFPLKVGRNTFYFKVWLQALGSDNKWYTLDATQAAEFWVRNGDYKLDEVWVLDEKEVELDWTPSQSEASLIETMLLEFNRRLYDSSDGQIRIKSFLFRRMRAEHSHRDPVIRIYRDFRGGDHGKVTDTVKTFIAQMRPFAYLGTPSEPGDIHLSFERIRIEGAELYSRAMVHEFHHATFGLTDEYGEVKDPQTGRQSFDTFCARDETLRRAWNSCIMGTYQPLHRELCTPQTHTHDASIPNLHAKDCYTRVKEALQSSLGLTLVIPDPPIEGPHDPPKPAFRWE